MKLTLAISTILICTKLSGQELIINIDTFSQTSQSLFPTALVTTTFVCTTSVGNIENGLRNGIWNFNLCDKSFLWNNTRFQTPIATVDYHDGQLAGNYISYYPDSTIKSEFHFQNGRLDGTFACYNEKRIMIYQGTVDPIQELANGKEFNSTGSFKGDRTFLIETLRRDWVNEIE